MFGVNLQSKLEELKKHESVLERPQSGKEKQPSESVTKRDGSRDARLFLCQVSDAFGVSSATNLRVHDAIIHYSRGEFDILRLYVTMFLVFRDSGRADWFCHFEPFLPPTWRDCSQAWLKHAIDDLSTQGGSGQWNRVSIGHGQPEKVVDLSKLVVECQRYLASYGPRNSRALTPRSGTADVAQATQQTVSSSLQKPRLPEQQPQPHGALVGKGADGTLCPRRYSDSSPSWVSKVTHDLPAVTIPAALPVPQRQLHYRQRNAPGPVSARAYSPILVPVKVNVAKRRLGPRHFVRAVTSADPPSASTSQQTLKRFHHMPFQQSQFVAFPQADMLRHRSGTKGDIQDQHRESVISPLSSVPDASHQNTIPFHVATGPVLPPMEPSSLCLFNPGPQPLRKKGLAMEPVTRADGPPIRSTRQSAVSVPSAKSRHWADGNTKYVAALEDDEARILGLGLRKRK